jgi:glycosyltransferase involved in cell wall biosynthesis
LIIAGVIQDKSLLREYETQKQLAQDNVVLINRRVSDAELAWLCQHADAAVMPYRDILTSGSFYQATTHALPTIAPTSGMFVTTVQDGENGLLYASDTALGDALIRANKLGKQHLKVLGQAALTRSLAQSASALFSARYQALLHQILKTGKVDAAF